MKLVIIDGQGGKMGRTVIEQLKKNLPDLEIYAIGTNSIATSAMLKAGADYGATGENPVIVGARTADIIIGPIGIVIADALMGEITPSMATAIGQSPAYKILIPVNRDTLTYAEGAYRYCQIAQNDGKGEFIPFWPRAKRSGKNNMYLKDKYS